MSRQIGWYIGLVDLRLVSLSNSLLKICIFFSLQHVLRRSQKGPLDSPDRNLLLSSTVLVLDHQISNYITGLVFNWYFNKYL